MSKHNTTIKYYVCINCVGKGRLVYATGRAGCIQCSFSMSPIYADPSKKQAEWQDKLLALKPKETVRQDSPTQLRAVLTKEREK